MGAGSLLNHCNKVGIRKSLWQRRVEGGAPTHALPSRLASNLAHRRTFEIFGQKWSKKGSFFCSLISKGEKRCTCKCLFFFKTGAFQRKLRENRRKKPALTSAPPPPPSAGPRSAVGLWHARGGSTGLTGIPRAQLTYENIYEHLPFS